MSKAIHSMIRVLDEERSVKFYQTAFGLRIADRIPFDGFTLIYMHNDMSDFEIELTVNHNRTEPYALGDGYGHMAFSVENLVEEHTRLTKAELNPTPIKELMHGGTPLAKFFFVQDPDGYKIEILQRHGRYL